MSFYVNYLVTTKFDILDLLFKIMYIKYFHNTCTYIVVVLTIQKTASNDFKDVPAFYLRQKSLKITLKFTEADDWHLLQTYYNSRYTEGYVLEQHLERVTSVDWAPNSNRIVTCAGDRNAYVWNFEPESGMTAIIL